jgi:heat shock 70kDa protein 1/2/6/8
MIVVDFKGETKKFHPEEISSMVLIKMREIAEAYLSIPLRKLSLPFPLTITNSRYIKS